jgi:sulfoquinovose isomerase
MPRSLHASPDFPGHWINDPLHRDRLAAEARAQFAFFRNSLRPDGRFDVLDLEGRPIPGVPQELHSTTRLVHSYGLGHIWGEPDCQAIIDAGMAFLWSGHRDADNGGYVWSVAQDGSVADGIKLAYGHVFVLLAGASARKAGHPDADRLISDAEAIIDRHYWDEDAGLLRDEFTRDWQVFSTYRGMNANMHGVEAMLAAYEATGRAFHLERAGRILNFFIRRMAPQHGWRLPEHYHEDWTVDASYSGNPMFRPAGTTPGHSFELGRLMLQHWELRGRPDDGAQGQARRLIEQAMADAWLPTGGLAYTLGPDGRVAIADRYWWPVTEAIGAYATLLRLGGTDQDEANYRRLWTFAQDHLIDHLRGGWFPELDAEGRPVGRQFHGKPDIYHSVQAALLPLLHPVARDNK